MISELRRTQGLLFNKISQVKDIAANMAAQQAVQKQGAGFSYTKFKQDLIETLTSLKLAADSSN